MITCDLQTAEYIPTLNEFSKILTARFMVAKVIIDSSITFNGRRIQKVDSSNIKMKMNDYLRVINPLEMKRCLRNLCEQNESENYYGENISLEIRIMLEGLVATP